MRTSAVSRRAVMALSLLILAAALVALLGWIFHLPRVLSSLGDSGRMSPDTSALFVVAAVCLLLMVSGRARKWRSIAAILLFAGGIVLVVVNGFGYLDLLERALLATFGFLVPGEVPIMSLATSWSFLLGGLAISILSLYDQALLSRAKLFVTIVCGTGMATLGCICILLFALDFPLGNAWLPGRWMIRMAIETAILFTLFGWVLVSEALRRSQINGSRILPYAGGTWLLLLLIGVNASLEVALQNNLKVRDEIREAQQSQAAIHHLVGSVHEAESGARGYLLTSDPGYLRAFDAGQAEAKNGLGKQLPLGEQWPEVDALRTVTQKRLAEIEQIVLLQQAGHAKEARSILETGRGRDLMERMEELQKLIDQRLDEQTNERNAAYWRSADLVRRTVITSYGLALALLICTVALFRIEIRRRASMEHRLRSSEADLEMKVEERTRELRESEEKFRLLTNLMPQVVWRSDATGAVDFYNERWYELTGAPRDVKGDKGWVPYVHPDDLAATAHIYRTALQEGRAFENELRLWDQQRREFRWYLIRSLPLRDERGKLCNWMGTSTDIHERRLAETLLKESRDAVESSRI